MQDLNNKTREPLSILKSDENILTYHDNVI